MNIDLRINGVTFCLGERPESEKLHKAKCAKSGFFGKRQMKIPRDEIVYTAKNCEVSCFGDAFIITPKVSLKASADEMVGTSVFLHFRNLILEKVLFQVLLNERVATQSTEIFEALCIGILGRPNTPRRWADGDGVVICELFHTRDRALFAWMGTPYAQERGLG